MRETEKRRYVTRQIPLLSKVQIVSDFAFENAMDLEKPSYLDEMIGKTGTISSIDANHSCGGKFPNEYDPMYNVIFDEPLMTPRAFCEKHGLDTDNNNCVPCILLTEDTLDVPLKEWQFFDEEFSVISLDKDSVALKDSREITTDLTEALPFGFWLTVEIDTSKKRPNTESVPNDEEKSQEAK